MIDFQISFVKGTVPVVGYRAHLNILTVKSRFDELETTELWIYVIEGLLDIFRQVPWKIIQ